MQFISRAKQAILVIFTTAHPRISTAVYFHYERAQQLILNSKTGVEAKRLGKKNINFNDFDWDKVKIGVMEDAISCKFEVPRMLKHLEEFYKDGQRKRRFVEISASPYWGCNYNVINDAPDFYIVKIRWVTL
uniref:DUF1768 domain-containing protein n=1 Tax=Strongyloides papillosus TaxID=174720 RepID=A0A0N5BRK3_STREA